MSSHPVNVVLDGEDFDILKRLHTALNSLFTQPTVTNTPRPGDEPGSRPTPEQREEGRRSRRSSTTEAGANTSSATATDGPSSSSEAPARRLRRQVEEPKATAPAAEKSTPTDTSTAPTTRRRRSEPEPAKPAEDKPIKDSDLSLAASEAATKIGPAEVKAIMEKFDDAEGFVVEQVSEIKPEDRRKFLDLLKAA